MCLNSAVFKLFICENRKLPFLYLKHTLFQHLHMNPKWTKMHTSAFITVYSSEQVWPMDLLFIKTSPVKQYSYENDFSSVFDAMFYYCNSVLFCCDRKRALEEEQRKTDIWSKETFNNTITNENYLDFKDIELQTQDGENLGQTESGLSVSTSRARRSYTANSGTQSSTVSGGSGLSFLGQHRKRASKVLPSKLFIGRSKSSYSDDALEVQEPESRGRASTFTHGKRRKVKHDTHNLVDHIETDDPQGILESVDNILKTQNKHIMTEL